MAATHSSALSPSVPTPEKRERLFFVVAAFAIAAIVASGFGLFFKAGFSSFGAPWWVHLHAVSFVSWIVLYLIQNLLVLQNSLQRHRAIGKVGAALAVWVVIVGFATTPITVATGRTPAFFTPPFFLALDWVNILFFAGLIYAGIAMRKQTDWHRRLMLCATVCVINPAMARLLISLNVMSPLTITLLTMALPLAGVIFDGINRRIFHKAYAVGGLVLFIMGPVINLVAMMPAMETIATWLAR